MHGISVFPHTRYLCHWYIHLLTHAYLNFQHNTSDSSLQPTFDCFKIKTKTEFFSRCKRKKNSEHSNNLFEFVQFEMLFYRVARWLRHIADFPWRPFNRYDAAWIHTNSMAIKVWVKHLKKVTTLAAVPTVYEYGSVMTVWHSFSLIFRSKYIRLANVRVYVCEHCT